LALAGVPLIGAAVFKLPEDQIGAMVAAHGAAWLLMSMPAGVMIDRMAPLGGVKRALLVSLAGLCLLLVGLSFQRPVLFAFGAFLVATAAVCGLLADGASLQRMFDGAELGRANARLQMLQSLAMFAGPLLMGWLVAKGFANLAFIAAAAFVLFSLLVARGFPAQEPPPFRKRAVLAEITEGFQFVRQQPLLRGIVACAVTWNLAFMALAAVFVPHALRHFAMTPSDIGMAQSAIGIGAILAALIAGWAMSNLPPRHILLFGPASSACGAMLLLIATPGSSIYLSAACYFSLGFGPILWFVCQNTIRQLVTPPAMLSRVGAVIQVALYGVRSIGALAAGKVAAAYGTDYVLWGVVSLFVASTLVVPLSALGGLSSIPRSASSQG
jgi:predicted MFS family arabinose efflux permease